MKSPAQRAAKRRAREDRQKDRSTWRCRCGGRHPIGERCPIRRRYDIPYPGEFGMPGLEIGVIAALAAVERRRR